MDTRTCTDLLVLSQAKPSGLTPVKGNAQEFGLWHCMSGECHMTERAVRTGCEMQGGGGEPLARAFRTRSQDIF